MTDDAAPTSSPPTDRASRRALAVSLIVVVVLVCIDQLTKAWAVRALADGPIEVFGDAVRFNLTRNPGGAFGRFQGLTPLLALGAIAVTVFLVRTVTRTTDRVLLMGLVLVLAGALGNLTDRIARDPGFLRGHVVDFVDVGPWPIFNIADSCVTVGIILLLWSGFLGGEDDE